MNRLAAYLAQHDLRQTEFARLIGVDQSRVSKFCRNEMVPTLALATRIEVATGGAVPANGWIDAGASA
jgi:transcriptional regulator with XRE-family HTH domain